MTFRIDRRQLAIWLALGAAPRARAQSGGFGAFLETLWPRAKAAGVSRATFDGAVAGLAPDAALIARGDAQPEFERPISAYVADATSSGRVATGIAMRTRWAQELAAIVRAQGVPAEIVLALWGMETGFGRASAGDHDVVRSLATLAYGRHDEAMADEVVAAMVMLERHLATRDNLKGSWAGAMGQPQFLPSAYLRYAVPYGRGGEANIWNSVPDALASIAHFMREQGWKPGLAWGSETIVPQGFDWRDLTGTFSAFAAKGFVRANGDALLPGGAATLYLPAGASGPAFLLSDNYWTIKQYNNSDSYALSVALMGERIAGRAGVKAAWPATKPLPAADRVKMQNLLHAKGFYDGKIDGKFGPLGREAVHRFQLSAGISPADGFASGKVLEALRGR